MTLKSVRLDLNQPLTLHEAFIGVTTYTQYKGGSIVSVNVDNETPPFTHERVTDGTPESLVVEDGTCIRGLRAKIHTTTPLEEPLVLGIKYSVFKDSVYKRVRPEQSTIELVLLNAIEIEFMPDEIYVMITADFENN